MFNLPKAPLIIALIVALAGGYAAFLKLRNSRLIINLAETKNELALKNAEVKALNNQLIGLRLQVSLNYEALAQYQQLSQTARQIVSRAQTIEPQAAGVVDHETSRDAVNFINDIFSGLPEANL